MIGEELEVENGEEGLNDIVAIWDWEGGFGESSDTVVALGDDAEDSAAACADLLEVGERFFVGSVLWGDDDDGEAVVDEGDGAVFHFAGGVSFGVNVGNFFEFECAF